MTPPPYSAPSSLLEQAHLALLRGQLKEARLMLEALIATDPNDVAAQDLLAQVALRQKSTTTGLTPQNSWWRRSFPNKSFSNLVGALLFFCYGLVQIVPVLQAGFAHGFGPQTTVMVGSRYPHQVPIGSLALHSGIPFAVAFVLLYVFFRQLQDQDQ